MSVNESKITEAIQSLTKFLKKNSKSSNQLLDIEHPDIVLLFSLTVIPQDSSYSPKFIQLPHTVSSKDKDICLLIGKNKDLAEELVQKNRISDIKEIIDIKEFKELYKTPEQKREICAKYPIFLADDLIMPQLPNHLGKVFFDLKKLPMKIRINSNLKDNVSKCRSKSCLYVSSGSNITMRVGSTDLSAHRLTENVLTAIQKACEHFPGGFSVVKSISLKSYNTPALPVYELTPGSLPVQDEPVKSNDKSSNNNTKSVNGSKPEGATNGKAASTPAKSPSKKAATKASNFEEANNDNASSTPVKSQKADNSTTPKKATTPKSKKSAVEENKKVEVTTPKKQTTPKSKKAAVEEIKEVQVATPSKTNKRKPTPELKSEINSASNAPKKTKASPKATKAVLTTPITDRKTRSSSRK